jgi:hypothetical protein
MTGSESYPTKRLRSDLRAMDTRNENSITAAAWVRSPDDAGDRQVFWLSAHSGFPSAFPDARASSGLSRKPGRSQRRPRNGFAPFSLLSPATRRGTCRTLLFVGMRAPRVHSAGVFVGFKCARRLVFLLDRLATVHFPALFCAPLVRKIVTIATFTASSAICYRDRRIAQKE